MATYTVTTTSRQDRAIARALSITNADRLANGQVPLTTEQFVQRLLRDTVQEHIRQEDEIEIAVLAAAYLAATNAVQNNIKSQLGIT